VHLECQVRERHRGQDLLAIELRFAGRVGEERDDAAAAAGAEIPDVEVGDVHVVVRLEAGADGALGLGRGAHVEQLPGGPGAEPPRPLDDDGGADDAHDRIEPAQPEVAASEERGDRQHAGEGVGEHVHVGRAQVVIVVGPTMVLAVVAPAPRFVVVVRAVVVVVVVLLSVAVVVRVVVIVRVLVPEALGVPCRDVVLVLMFVLEQPRAGEVDDQADHGDRQRFGEVDLGRAQEPRDGFEEHPQGDDGEREGARVAGERVDLAGAEGEGAVARAGAGEPVGERGHAEGAGVRRHVPAVGGEGERAGQLAHHELEHHHDHGQPDDGAGARLASVGVRYAAVIESEVGGGFVGHGALRKGGRQRRWGVG
jgi:hypothetical protein